MTGRVIKSTGSWYRVQLEDGALVDARLRGAMRLQGSRATNPVAVCDFVTLEPESEGRYAISHVLERKNHMVRRSVNLSKKTQVIAANLDQAILVCTIAEPKTLLGFMDRFLASAEAYGIPARLVFNKMDACGPEELDELRYREAAYQRAGYPCLRVSAVTGEGLPELKALLKDQVTLFSGHSGVGKSTLANALQPGLDLKTGEISDAHGQGRHTTTFAEMHPLDFGGYLIDTPGIRGFGLVNMEKDQVSHYFPEIFALGEGCKYHNCTHVDEPNCAVLAAYEAHHIAPSRYENYVHMLKGDEGEDPYRHAESKMD